MIRRYTTQGLSCRDLKATRRIAHQVGVLVSLSSNPSATPSGNILRLMRAFRTYLCCFLGGQNHRWIHQGFVEPFVSKLPGAGPNSFRESELSPYLQCVKRGGASLGFSKVKHEIGAE